MSASSKRRRATSPSSSVSGGGDLDETSSSTPGSGRKRRRTSNAAPVDTVTALDLPQYFCIQFSYLFLIDFYPFVAKYYIKPSVIKNIWCKRLLFHIGVLVNINYMFSKLCNVNITDILMDPSHWKYTTMHFC